MRVDIGRKQPTLIRQTRKESDNLSKPCICIDVSKDTSHVQGFIDFNKSVSKHAAARHTGQGAENGGVDGQDIGHCQECGDARHNLCADIVLLGIEAEDSFDSWVHICIN